VNAYRQTPARLLTCLLLVSDGNPSQGSYCAGFELKKWRCAAFADHLIEWMADYALKEDELDVKHTNMYVRLKQAAARVYQSDKYETRGEVGDISLHAICRDFFETIPLAPRVFYLTASNDVVKSFDMVHVRYSENDSFELWLGESKFYKDPNAAIKSAIGSVEAHIDAGFLNREKLILGPQVSKELPLHDEIRALLSEQTSLDKLFSDAVFPICILAESAAISHHETHCEEYLGAVKNELLTLNNKIVESGLATKIRILLIYLPIESKEALSAAFDQRLKGLAP
jgi:hypothetical protein